MNFKEIATKKVNKFLNDIIIKNNFCSGTSYIPQRRDIIVLDSTISLTSKIFESYSCFFSEKNKFVNIDVSLFTTPKKVSCSSR